MTLEETADTLRVLDLHMCSRLDPMETIGMRGLHEYDCLELVAIATNGDDLAAADNDTWQR